MKDITPQELKQRMANNEPLNIIDVRESWEYNQSHIAKKNIPLTALAENFNNLMHLKDEEIILYCRSGARGEIAKRFLQRRGFTKARNLLQGMDGYLQT